MRFRLRTLLIVFLLLSIDNGCSSDQRQETESRERSIGAGTIAHEVHGADPGPAEDEPAFAAPKTNQAWIVTENGFPRPQELYRDRMSGFNRFRAPAPESTNEHKDDAVGVVFLIEDSSVYILDGDQKRVMQGEVTSWRQNRAFTGLDILWEAVLFSECIVSRKSASESVLIIRSDDIEHAERIVRPNLSEHGDTAEYYVLQRHSLQAARELRQALR